VASSVYVLFMAANDTVVDLLKLNEAQGGGLEQWASQLSLLGQAASMPPLDSGSVPDLLIGSPLAFGGEGSLVVLRMQQM